MLFAECISNEDCFEKCEELSVGTRYEVDFISMGQRYTTIYLIGHKHGFNSVLFEFYDENELVDIYKSSKYNSYL